MELVIHDVLRMVTKKSPQYSFIPGQATEVAINKDGWKEAKRPFTLFENNGARTEMLKETSRSIPIVSTILCP